MPFILFLRVFLSSLVFYLAVDFLWLGLIARKFYEKELGAFSRTLNLPAAIVVYLGVVLGILLFVYPKTHGIVSQGFLWGALFGAIVYGVYDLTNLATLSGWSLKMTVVDMLWGIFICGLVGAFMVFIARVFGA